MNFKPPLRLDKQTQKLQDYKRVVYKNISKKDSEDYLLKYNYTNLITPFKYNFCKWKDNKEVVKDSNGNHIYERDVDFSEYLNYYKDERNCYVDIYKNISKFETIFKSVLAYRVLINYNIIDEAAFDLFIRNLKENSINGGKKFDDFFGSKYREKCINYFNGFKKSLTNSYNDNIYVFFENLTLGKATAIFNCCNKTTRKEIFSDLIKYNVSFGYHDYKIFGQKLLIIKAIRDKVYHSSSVQIAILFHDIKKGEIRLTSGPFSQEAFRNVLNILKK